MGNNTRRSSLLLLLGESKAASCPLKQNLTLWTRLKMTLSSGPNHVQILKQKFTQSLGLPFQDLLPESVIKEALADEKLNEQQRLFDPFVTLWAFLSQVLAPDKSCHNAVSRVIAWLASEHAEIPSEDTSAYCQARKRNP